MHMFQHPDALHVGRTHSKGEGLSTHPFTNGMITLSDALGRRNYCHALSSDETTSGARFPALCMAH